MPIVSNGMHDESHNL